MTSQNVKERRVHRRFAIASDTNIYTFGGLAHLMDMSNGGFSVEYLDGGLEAESVYHTNFLVCNDRYCFKNLSIKIAWAGEKFVCSSNMISIQPIGAMFYKISAYQKKQLEKFIHIYSGKELLA